MSSWRPALPQDIAWREWDDELVVYNRISGDTHHLDPMGSRIFRALLDHPAGIGVIALTRLVADGIESADAHAVEAAVKQGLEELQRLRLAAHSDA